MDLYYMPGSLSCQTVIMAAKVLGVKLNKKLLNLRAGENRTPEFLKINPQHTIPTIVDYGFGLWESRAILIYLAEKSGNTDLYPKCPKKRAVINQRLFFDLGTLYNAFSDCYHTTSSAGQKEKFKKLEAAFDFLNAFLEGQTYAAGDSLTIADIALITTVTTYDVTGFNINKYKNVARWYENAKKVLPGFEEMWAGALELKKFLEEKHVLELTKKE